MDNLPAILNYQDLQYLNKRINQLVKRHGTESKPEDFFIKIEGHKITHKKKFLIAYKGGPFEDLEKFSEDLDKIVEDKYFVRYNRRICEYEVLDYTTLVVYSSWKHEAFAYTESEEMNRKHREKEVKQQEKEQDLKHWIKDEAHYAEELSKDGEDKNYYRGRHHAFSEVIVEIERRKA